MAGDTRVEWLQRVLGIAAPTTPPQKFDEAAFRKNFGVAIVAWRTAFESVGEQINVLRKLLLETADPDLHQIAEFGLNGITGTRRVTLEKAMREIAGSKGDAVVTLAGDAARAAADFRNFVSTDPRIAACDACPTNTVQIGVTLGTALAALEKAMTV